MKIHFGRISEFSETEYQKAYALMTQNRKSQVDRMRFDADKKRSVLGEWLARKAVCEILGRAEAEIIFSKTENGKPYCENAPIYFSISHCKDMAVAIASGSEIGIDVEYIRDIDYRITRFACVDSDMEYLNSSKDEEEKKNTFFRIWTAKEAYVKFLGTGIKDLKSIAYKDIKDNCKTEIHNGYMITVYCEKQSF